MKDLNVVLCQPEIPQNTGNIARTCVAAGAALHLIEPLGFSLSEKKLKRAGLDYWERLEWDVYPSLDSFWAARCERTDYFTSKRGYVNYAEVSYASSPLYLYFGRETKGLPYSIITAERKAQRLLRIPMAPGERSLNLSNSVAIVVYEALRQRGFADLQQSFEKGREEYGTE